MKLNTDKCHLIVLDYNHETSMGEYMERFNLEKLF